MYVYVVQLSDSPKDVRVFHSRYNALEFAVRTEVQCNVALNAPPTPETLAYQALTRTKIGGYDTFTAVWIARRENFVKRHGKCNVCTIQECRVADDRDDVMEVIGV